MLAQIVLPLKFVINAMAYDAKTFNVFSRNDYATKSGILFQKNT